MIRLKATFNTKSFQRDMKNLVEYSAGFLEGAKNGKNKMLENLGPEVIQALSQYIDTNARMNPAALHHVYEWSKTGIPGARLFQLNYTISNLGLSIKSSFKQSSSIQNGSTVPFYDKARIMESGVPVTIRPKKNVLVFQQDGETIFTKNPVTVNEPGGAEVQGSYERTFDEFFRVYFTQAFLSSSGILKYLKDPSVYKKSLRAGVKQGRSYGKQVGYTWIANAKLGVE